MIHTRQITAALMFFAMIAGCVDSVGQENQEKTGAASRPTPIILQADGVSQGKDWTFRYGTEITEIITMLERFGPVYRNANEECGAGPMVQVASHATGLTLNFQQDRLVGWFFDGDARLARTARGISVGSSREALEKAMPVEMEPDSTLGIEFFSRLNETG
ncbi:hypothetical protein, partial [Parasphingorhabdus sp.]|uniref:hypothetical protein n=1 Tax=Parasphingorhabdus sp. TaxID=2709688 RepID=UPI003C76E211